MGVCALQCNGLLIVHIFINFQLSHWILFFLIWCFKCWFLLWKFLCPETVYNWHDSRNHQEAGRSAVNSGLGFQAHPSRKVLSHLFTAFLKFTPLGKVSATSCPQGLPYDSAVRQPPLSRPALVFMSLMAGLDFLML